MRKLLVMLFVATTAFAGAARGQFCLGVAPWVFADIQASDAFCTYITWMAQTGVTTGCQVIDANNRLYCPDDLVTRKQMAAFMGRLGMDATFAEGGNAFGTRAVLGTTDNNVLEVRVNNRTVMRYEPNSISPNVIGGSPSNFALHGVRGATIAGGGSPYGDPDFGGGGNRVTDIYGTVGGGNANQAGDNEYTTTDSPFATVGGGRSNWASEFASTVGGGATNTASGSVSMVGGGGVATPRAGHTALSAGAITTPRTGRAARSAGAVATGRAGLRARSAGVRATPQTGGAARSAGGGSTTRAGNTARSAGDTSTPRAEISPGRGADAPGRRRPA